MAGIFEEVSMRESAYANNPQALQQRYAQSQQLIDLLALQQLNNEKQAAANQIQASMQTNPSTVRDQLEQEALMTSRNEIISELAPGIQQRGTQMQQTQGVAGMPAPNMMRAAQGGIVGYAEGGKTKQQDAPFLSPSSEEAQRQRYLKLKEIEAKFLAEGNQEGLRNIRRELMNYEGSTAAQAPAPTPENTAGMVGGGIVGYAKGGAMYDEMGRQSTNKNMNEMFETLTSQDPTGPMNPLSKEFAERIRLLEREIDLITRPRRKAKMMDIPTKGNVFPTDAPPELLNELNLLKEARAKALAANDMAGGGIVSLKEGGFPDLSGDGKITRKDILMGRGVVNKQQGGIVSFAQGDPVVDLNAETRFDVEENLYSPEEAIEVDQVRDVGMVYGPFDMARDIRGILSTLPESQGVSKEAMLRMGMMDATGAFTPRMQEERIAQIEEQISNLPPEDRMPRRETQDSEPSLPQNEGITAAMYRGEPTNLEKLRSIMDQPRVGRKPKEDSEQDIDFRALSEFLLGGAGQTTTAGALGGAGRRLNAYELAERRQAEALNAQALDRLLKQNIAQQDYRLAVAKLNADYTGKIDTAVLDIANDALGRLDLDPEYRAALDDLADTYDFGTAEYDVAKGVLLNNTIERYVNAAKESALGKGMVTGVAGDAGIVG